MHVHVRCVCARVCSTAIGIDQKGALQLVVIDGEEDIGAGANLFMLQDIMMALGSYHAVNLDGGGSSVAVYNGKWVSHPTCSDNKTPCEREVSTITCVKA